MQRRKIELFVDVNNEKEFYHILHNNLNTLICAEIYCHFSGPCTALDRLFTTIKLDWSNGKMVLLKVPADDIEVLKRFRNQSEPIYMFILNNRVTKVFRGVNSIEFAEVAKTELQLFKAEQQGISTDRQTYALDEVTPNEVEWFRIRDFEKQQEIAELEIGRAARQAARKRHRAELMVPHLQHLNFVLFWPHTTHAHHELYERWDVNNIVMVGREEIQLTKETAEDVMYAGDACLNEASLHVLLSAPALVICFRLLDTDKHFVSLVRKILYEEIPPLDETKPTNEQLLQKTAFDLYKSFSPTREEIWQQRREEKQRQKEEMKEKRARRLSEMQRLARQAIEDAIEAKRMEKEQRKLELLKAGNLSELDKMHDEGSDDEDVDITVPEELSDIEEEAISEEEDENEYFPPAGLVIPGFYAPPNDIAKVNGLAILFPRLVLDNVTPEPEFLPPHVVVMIDIAKRYKAIEIMDKYKSSIIYMGIFKAKTPFDAVHVAYSVKEYNQLLTANPSLNKEDMKLVFSLSVKSELAVLELMSLDPVHVSRDTERGEVESAALFPVEYADNCSQLQDWEVAA